VWLGGKIADVGLRACVEVVTGKELVESRGPARGAREGAGEVRSSLGGWCCARRERPREEVQLGGKVACVGSRVHMGPVAGKE
jgi:hypothetical protein